METDKELSKKDRDEMTSNQLAHDLYKWIKRRADKGHEVTRGHAKVFMNKPQSTFYDVVDRMLALYPLVKYDGEFFRVMAFSTEPDPVEKKKESERETEREKDETGKLLNNLTELVDKQTKGKKEEEK